MDVLAISPDSEFLTVNSPVAFCETFPGATRRRHRDWKTKNSARHALNEVFTQTEVSRNNARYEMSDPLLIPTREIAPNVFLVPSLSGPPQENLALSFISKTPSDSVDWNMCYVDLAARFEVYTDAVESRTLNRLSLFHFGGPCIAIVSQFSAGVLCVIFRRRTSVVEFVN